MSRLIASLIAAFALILSPVLMTGAAVASSHQPMAMEMAGPMAGHCEGMLPAKSDDVGGAKGAMKIDCAAACSALQPLPPLLAQRGCFAVAMPARIAVAQLDGITVGHEPPPPRFAPEI